MLHLYTDKESPNGYKVAIALEEAGAPYLLHPINLGKGEHKTAQFLAMNPHGRVPVLQDDTTGVTIFESGAILLYLAERLPILLPQETKARWQAVQWMVYHSASCGPSIGQLFNFAVSEQGRNVEATARFQRLVHEAFSTLDGHLSDGRSYFVAEQCTIADIAHFGWFYSMQQYQVPFDSYPHIVRWFATMLARPAVAKAIAAVQESVMST